MEDLSLFVFNEGGVGHFTSCKKLKCPSAYCGWTEKKKNEKKNMKKLILKRKKKMENGFVKRVVSKIKNMNK